MKQPLHLPLSEVKSFAASLAKQLHGSEILALVGDLGSGKTTFAQALAKALGVKQKVLSPTFIVLQEFPTKRQTKTGKLITLVHLDLYRTKNFRELKALGLDQIWGQPQTITVIEWADKIKKHLPPNTTYINLHRDVI
jgi:tRNA threonylcarbamoyladenosine biosynthesis protein TsaE